MNLNRKHSFFKENLILTLSEVKINDYMRHNRLIAEKIISAYSMIILEFEFCRKEFGAMITKKIPKSLFWEKIFPENKFEQYKLKDYGSLATRLSGKSLRI